MDEHISLVNAGNSNVSDALNQAKEFLKEQNFDEARKVLEEVLKLDSDNVDANYILGQIYEFSEEYEKSIKCYSKLMQQNPSMDVKYKLAQSFQNADDYNKAYDVMKDIYQQKQNDVNVCEQFAHVSRVVGKNADAVDAYNKILEIEKNDMVALTQLSEIYYDEGDKLNHYLIKARVNYIDNMLSNSVDCLKRALNYAVEDDDLVNVLLNLGKVLTDKGSLNEAMEQYQFVLATQPENQLAKEKMQELEKIAENYDEYSNSWIDKLVSFLK